MHTSSDPALGHRCHGRIRHQKFSERGWSVVDEEHDLVTTQGSGLVDVKSGGVGDVGFENGDNEVGGELIGSEAQFGEGSGDGGIRGGKDYGNVVLGDDCSTVLYVVYRGVRE